MNSDWGGAVVSALLGYSLLIVGLSGAYAPLFGSLLRVLQVAFGAAILINGALELIEENAIHVLLITYLTPWIGIVIFLILYNQRLHKRKKEELMKLAQKGEIKSLIESLVDPFGYKIAEKILGNMPGWSQTKEAQILVPFFINILSKDKDSHRRYLAAKALSEIKDRRAITPLVIAAAEDVTDAEKALEK